MRTASLFASRSQKNNREEGFLVTGARVRLVQTGAAVFGVSTLYRWTLRNFLEHHLPLVVVAGCMLAQCDATDGRVAPRVEE